MITLHARRGEADVLMLAAAEPPSAPLTEAEQQQLIFTSRELALEAAVSKISPTHERQNQRGETGKRATN